MDSRWNDRAESILTGRAGGLVLSQESTMSDHIEVAKRAIEFRRPDYLPMEIIDVPHVYNAYHTLDPATVQFVPGTEDFDVMWPCCYSWYHTITGKTPEGEVLKEDQFGVKLKTPLDEKSAYVLLEHPLAGRESLDGYEFPNPANLLDVIPRGRYLWNAGRIAAQKYMGCNIAFGTSCKRLNVAFHRSLLIPPGQGVPARIRRLGFYLRTT